MTDVSTTEPTTEEPIEEGAPEAPGTGATLVPGANADDPVTPAEPERRTYKVKVLDKEEELSLTDEEATRYIQKGKGADKKFEEAARIRKESEATSAEARRLFEIFQSGDTKEIRKLLTNPKLGLNLRAIAEEHLTEELEKEMLDPRERELREREARIEAKEAEENAAKEEAEKAKFEEEDSKRVTGIKNALAKKFGQVMKDSVLPNNERTVSKIAYYMQHAAKNDVPFDVVDIRDQVIEDYREDFTKLVGSQDVEKIAEFLGEEIIGKIRKWDNERVSKGTKPKPRKPTDKQSPFRKQKRKFKTAEQDNLEKFGTLYPYVDEL